VTRCLICVLAVVIAGACSAAGSDRASGSGRATTVCSRRHIDLGLGAPSSLSAVAALGPTDVWAVGVRGSGDGRPLIEHYDGRRWRGVGVGLLGRGGLSDVAARSPNDIWVAGPTPTVGRGGVSHWDGRRWARVPLPRVVYSVDALSVADGAVWLLAGDENGWTIALRWTGRRWQMRRAGLPRLYAGQRGNGSGRDIAMVSSRDGWIVGSGFAASGADQSFVTRWNGRTWKTVRVPTALRGEVGEHDGESVQGVAAVDASNVWAIASAASSGFAGWYTLHWDGRRWRLARKPGGAVSSAWSGNTIAIDFTRQGEGWLVAGDDTAIRKTSSGGWSAVSTPTRYIELGAVSSDGAGSAWAVGGRLRPDYEQSAVVEHIVCPA
jgi:hypothetical protein